MITENLSTLKIHKLTQEQYSRELANGNIDETALYLTPETIIEGNCVLHIHDMATYAGILNYRKINNIYYLYGEIGVETLAQGETLFDIYNEDLPNDFKFPNDDEYFMVYKESINETQLNYEPISMRFYQDESIGLTVLSVSSAVGGTDSKAIVNITYVNE